VLSRSIVDNFDQQLEVILNGMIGASEIDSIGEVRLNRTPADHRFVRPYSGLYFQVSGPGRDSFPSRSWWDRRLEVRANHSDTGPHIYDSDEFSTAKRPEPLRVIERDVVLPGSDVRWRFQVAQSRKSIDAQLHRLRSTLTWSFTALGFGLIMLAALQTVYGLWPLRRVRRGGPPIPSGARFGIGHAFPAQDSASGAELTPPPASRGRMSYPRPKSERS